MMPHLYPQIGILGTPRVKNQFHSTAIISGKIRQLALASGCVVGLAGFFYAGPFSLIAVCPLILGALIQPHFPRSGRLLLSVGVFLPTFYAGFFLVSIAISFSGLRS